jgi:hypothetical protein
LTPYLKCDILNSRKQQENKPKGEIDYDENDGSNRSNGNDGYDGSNEKK